MESAALLLIIRNPSNSNLFSGPLKFELTRFYCINTFFFFSLLEIPCDETRLFFLLSTDDVDECSSGTPCQNGGACANSAGSFTCTCRGSGFSGTTCSGNINMVSNIFLAFFQISEQFICCQPLVIRIMQKFRWFKLVQVMLRIIFVMN